MGFYLAAVIRRIMHGSWQRTRRCVRVSGGRLRPECRFWRNAVDFYIYTVRLKEAMENTGKWLAFIHLTLTGRTACARFGYVRLLTSSGQEIHGHEFHYWESEDPGTDWEAVKPTGNRSWRCIHEKGGQIGGFPHLYYASCPDFLRKWLDVCAKGSQKKYIN